MMEAKIKRGDIFYVALTSVIGSEQFAGRPAIIVSCDENNEHSETVEVVYLTTRPKASMPTHVSIYSAKHVSIALCEQVTTVSKTRLGCYHGSCTAKEMGEIDAAIAVSLGLDKDGKWPIFQKLQAPTPIEVMSKGTFEIQNISSLELKMARVEAERDVYRGLYESAVLGLMPKKCAGE